MSEQVNRIATEGVASCLVWCRVGSVEWCGGFTAL